MRINFYGLLHLEEGEHSAINVPVIGFCDQITLYLDCAINLSNSLRARGIEFTLLTNKKDVLEEILQSEKKNLQVKEIPFTTRVPHGTKFYSGHFKLDAFRYFSTLNEGYVGLCDLDMVCINDFPQCFSNNILQKIPMCYDISDQVIPAYGHEVIIRDLGLIEGLESEGRWSGGEFISGTPEFFLTLAKKIDNLYENYINNLEKFHHNGDEAFVSAALETMRKNGTYIADAGTLGIVGRFWSGRTLHLQKPFKYFQHCFLLHLPADKRFLAEMSAREPIMESSKFAQAYIQYRNSPITKFNRLIGHISKMKKGK